MKSSSISSLDMFVSTPEWYNWVYTFVSNRLFNCVLLYFSDEARGSNQGVLVHCLAGVSRSVTITVAYLMQTKKLTLNDAYDYVKTCKPNISPNFNFMGQLLEFQRSLGHMIKCSCGESKCTCSDISRLISEDPSQSSMWYFFDFRQFQKCHQKLRKFVFSFSGLLSYMFFNAIR